MMSRQTHLARRRQYLVATIGAQRVQLERQLGGLGESLGRGARIAGAIAGVGGLLLARGAPVSKARRALRFANMTLRWWVLARCLAVLVGVAAGVGSPRAELVQAPVAPDVLMKGLTSNVLGILRADSAAGQPTNVADLVETLIVPLFDFPRMTSMAVARNWPLATIAQQEALTAQFKTLLVQTYSGALSTYRDHRIEYLPLRAASGDAEVTVRSTLTRPRATFAAQVRKGGVDSLEHQQ